jgi:hypothetical protein
MLEFGPRTGCHVSILRRGGDDADWANPRHPNQQITAPGCIYRGGFAQRRIVASGLGSYASFYIGLGAKVFRGPGGIARESVHRAGRRGSIGCPCGGDVIRHTRFGLRLGVGGTSVGSPKSQVASF